MKTVKGHQEGRHAPGLLLPISEVLKATHNALLAHGKSVQAIRPHSVKRQTGAGRRPAGRAPHTYYWMVSPESLYWGPRWRGVRGYFHWSIMGNFEWAVAYQQIIKENRVV